MFYEYTDLIDEFDIDNTLSFYIPKCSLKYDRYTLNVAKIENDILPINRTITPTCITDVNFSEIENTIISKIQKRSNLYFNPNVANIEIFNNEYRTMRYYTDSMLDLYDGSHIAIFSYYKCTCKKLCERTLYFKNKVTNEGTKVSLKNNSVIIFSLDTNKKYLHKIVLENKKNTECKWLGITFKQSIRYIHKPINDISSIFTFPEMSLLNRASDKNMEEFYKLKSEENKLIDFKYPYIGYIW